MKNKFIDMIWIIVYIIVSVIVLTKLIIQQAPLWIMMITIISLSGYIVWLGIILYKIDTELNEIIMELKERK